VKCRLAATFIVSLFASMASAHEVRPGYLQLRETGVGRYDVLWKVPSPGGSLRLALDASLPAACTRTGPVRTTFAEGSCTETWAVTCDGGLAGGTIRIDGLARTPTDVLARVERADGTTQVARLTPGAPSFVVEAAPSTAAVALAYTGLGFEHILLGFDHLLYILAMLLMVRGFARIVWTMTAFTATHSLTLTAAALGWVHVPQRPVEACIALSILFVAAEIVRSRQGRSGLTERFPWVVSLTFGLLHGFGFAGALAEVGLPQKAIPAALLFFNVGVEIGQLVFVAGVLGAAALGRALARRARIPDLRWAWRLSPYAIGGAAAFWLVQRIAAF
jgi:hydrogenase/urease accessory protein HupE